MASANLTGYTGGHASYPPELISMTKLGYVKEHSGVQYSRDVGRTSAFAHTQFFIFGDTFCWDGQGQFVGVQSNTASIINAPVPIETTYPSIQPNGLVDPLIPLTEHEKRLEKEENVRVTLWPFGGIVETQPGWGWAWFEKGVVHSPDGRNEPCGIGIAQIRMDQSSGNVIRVNRGPGLIFEKEEPRFGGFSSCLEGNYIYLWGHHDNNILLARVRRDRPIARSHYEYWNGREYVKNWELAVPVLQDVQQGAVVKSTLFGPDLPWVFVGCTRFADSKVMMGAAARLEGPWELTAVCQASGIDYPNGYMYCMYPHVWAFEEEKGELMVTWSEPYPGNVIAAKLKLKMEKQRHWRRVMINEYPETVCASFMPGTIDANKISEMCSVEYSLEAVMMEGGGVDETEPVYIKIVGNTEGHVNGAAVILMDRLRVMEQLVGGEGSHASRRTSLRRGFLKVGRFFSRRSR